MRVLVTIQHPANVHFFRHVIEVLESRGHTVRVVVRDKDVTTELLRRFDIEHTVLGGETNGLFDLIQTQLQYEYGVYRVARRFDPDVITASGGLTASHVATLTGTTSVVFLDTETTVAVGNRLTVPFADVICTPRSYQETYGSAHRRYDGLHELAYLDADRFDADPELLQSAGVDPDEQYFVVRFNAWDAHHDVNKRGFSLEGMHSLVDSLSEHGTVYVSHEGSTPPAFKAYEPPTSPHHIHHLLAGADLFVGEVATMTIEAAVLGTPTVRLSPFAGLNDMGKFQELENRYGLVHSFPETQEADALAQARTLAVDDDAPSRWGRRRNRLLDETVDVASYVADTIYAEACPT